LVTYGIKSFRNNWKNDLGIITNNFTIDSHITRHCLQNLVFMVLSIGNTMVWHGIHLFWCH
jgi:hypothetical protein